MSNCLKHQLLLTANVRTTRIVAGLITGLNVSLKSKPGTWLNPFATNLDLYLLTDPSRFCFTLKTHLQPIMCLWSGGKTKAHVSFVIKALNSCCIALKQWREDKASWTELGSLFSSSSVWVVSHSLGLKIPDFDLVCIEYLGTTGCKEFWGDEDS